MLSGISKDLFIARCEQLWHRRDVTVNARLIRRVIQQRFCSWCHKEYTSDDPRTKCCSRVYAQKRRRFLQEHGVND